MNNLHTWLSLAQFFTWYRVQPTWTVRGRNGKEWHISYEDMRNHCEACFWHCVNERIEQ